MSDRDKKLCICCGKDVTYADRLDYATLTCHIPCESTWQCREEKRHYICKDCHIFGANKRIQDAARKWFQLKADLSER